MSTGLPTPEPAALTDEERRLAREGVRTLRAGLARASAASLRLEVEGRGLEIRLPDQALGPIAELLAAMAEGKPVTVHSPDDEMTTQEAADLLRVSRPFLIGLLDKGEMAHHRVGSQRRLKAADVLAYRERREARARAALREMVAPDQELKIGC